MYTKSMIIIRDLEKEEYKAAVEIKYCCWINDYGSFIKIQDNFKMSLLNELIDWMAIVEDDVRVIKGIFVNGTLTGFIGASFAEKEDSQNGVEINYLFVSKPYRNKGFSLLLIQNILEQYRLFKSKEVIVYSFQKASSNLFYRSLKAELLRTDEQISGENKRLLVDVFVWDIDKLLMLVKKKLEASDLQVF